MKRKLTALILAAVMLASMCSAATAEEAAAAPTVDEILNEYHQKAMEQQMQGDSAAYARSGRSSEKTLEQETVDTLTAAGYEAYNVTADNFDALEAELKTDFADMGLDSDGSYILVIEASADVDENSSGGNPNARSSPEIDFEQGPISGGLPTTYTYNGVTYNLRHITATSATSSTYHVESSYTFADKLYFPSSWSAIDDLYLVGVSNGVLSSNNASVASLISSINEICDYASLSPKYVVANAETSWTRRYIHVYDDRLETWSPVQYSEYADTTGYLSYFIDDEEVKGMSFSKTHYSPYYFETSIRVENAVLAFATGGYDRDPAYVSLYMVAEDMQLGNGRCLFTHYSPFN